MGVVQSKLFHEFLIKLGEVFSNGVLLNTAGRSIFYSNSILVLGVFFVFPQFGYAGCVKGNCKNGTGVMVTQKGDIYSGAFRNNKLEGQGSWKSRHGDVYKGSFKNGVVYGKGKLTLSNGEYYIGEFKNGKFSGRGKYSFRNGDSYIGQWERGKMNGEGVYYFKDGRQRSGAFKEGKLIEESISEYDAEYTVTNTFNEGAQVTAARLDNVVKDCTHSYCDNVLGIYNYGDGTRYIGEFKNGIPDGIGRCEFKNGDLYEGEWKKHAPHGKGILTFASGKKHAAIWEQGIPKEQLLEDYDYVHKVKKSTNRYSKDVNVYALVVGVATYEHMPSLKYTDDDAYQLYAFLKSPEGGAIPNENIKVLVDDVATKNNILMSMEQLFSKADENDVVLLYMSGHGLKGSFVPSDFNGYNNQLAYNEIIKILDKSKAKHKICIADACHSGSLMTSKGSSFAPAVNNYYSILNNLEAGGTAMLLSSAANELSLEYSGLRHGVFSHYLMNGMRGEADSNDNKVVTISELYAYMYTNVRAYTQNKQSPILTGTYNKDMPVAVIR
ncbi:MAG: caspase family protein [Saprospiraceae bacterium]|nr:caspase family protein [Saprospiraceae bacterium]